MHEEFEPLHEEIIIHNQENLYEVLGPRRSSRIGKSAILNDYVVYFQHEFDLKPKDDAKTFSQARRGEFWLMV